MFLQNARLGIIPSQVRRLRTSSAPFLKSCTVILAVSTAAPNPLQAITTLHARTLDLPPWVDRNILRYTLIIHPQNSVLSDEEYVS